MTGEQFRKEYHLLDRVSSGAVETCHAQAATGAMIMVHFLRGTPEENAAVLARLPLLEPTRAARVLRTLEVDGVTTVVTRFILDFVTLEEWIRDGVRSESTLPVSTPAVPRPAGAEAGPPASPPVPHAGPPAPVSPPAPVAPPTPVAPAYEAPVLETPRDISAPAGIPVDRSRQPEPAPEPEAAPPEPEPGEFTRMFKAVTPRPQVESVRPVAPPSSSAPPVQPAPPAQPAPPVQSPPDDAPGEFTMMFRAASPPPAERTVPDPAPAAGAPPPSATPQLPEPVTPAPTTPAPENVPPGAGPSHWLATLQAETAQAQPDVPASAGEAPSPQVPLPAAPTTPPPPVPPFAAATPAAPPARYAAGPTPPAPIHREVSTSSPPKPPPAPAGPGDFTQMFGAAARPSDLPASTPLPPPTSGQRPHSAPLPPAASAPTSWPAQPTPPGAPAPPPSYASGSGFGDTGTPRPPFTPHAAPPSEPGEYTRLFGSPTLPPPAPPPAGASQQSAQPSSFDSGAAGGNYFERLAASTPKSGQPLPPPVTPAPPGPYSSGPSEFTRIISAAQVPGPPPMPRGAQTPLQPQKPAPAAGKTDRTLVLALIGVLIAAVIFVVLVAVIG